MFLFGHISHTLQGVLFSNLTDRYFSFLSVSKLLEHLVIDLPCKVYLIEKVATYFMTISAFEIEIWDQKLSAQKTVFANLATNV